MPGWHSAPTASWWPVCGFDAGRVLVHVRSERMAGTGRIARDRARPMRHERSPAAPVAMWPLAACQASWHDSCMASQIWGTFSVKDHCRANAFVREVLLFDRLVLPVPSDEQERSRWRQPNPKNPQENWDPDRLDVLRNILGSQDILAEPVEERGLLGTIRRRRAHSPPALSPHPLVWDSPWNEQRWQGSQVDAAKIITNMDAFYAPGDTCNGARLAWSNRGSGRFPVRQEV